MAIEKDLLERMRQRQSGWRVEDLEIVARNPERDCIVCVHGKFLTITHPRFTTTLTIPMKSPVKLVFVTQFLDLIDLIDETE